MADTSVGPGPSGSRSASMQRILPVLAACRSSPACTAHSRRRVCFSRTAGVGDSSPWRACREDGPCAGTGHGLRRAELLLRPGRRSEPVRVALDGTSTLGHLVKSLGVPLTEVRRLQVNGSPARPGYRPAHGDVVGVEAVQRPQHLPSARFVLDVHLGTLARQLRLAGVDAAYANDATDDALVWQANDERRVLLTQDRGLLHRRQLWQGAYVRGARPDEQLTDVLDRFAPPLAPWTRCPACNGRCTPQRRQTLILCCSRHPPHLPGVLPLRGLRPGVLARRAQQAP